MCTRTCLCPLRILLQLLAWVYSEAQSGCGVLNMSVFHSLWVTGCCTSVKHCEFYPFSKGLQQSAHWTQSCLCLLMTKPETSVSLHKGSLLFFPVADRTFFIGSSVSTFSVLPQLSCWSTWPRYRKFALNHFFLSCLGRGDCWALVLAPDVLPQQCSEQFLLFVCCWQWHLLNYQLSFCGSPEKRL